MLTNTPSDRTLIVKIECFDTIVDDDKYIAWIEGKEYKGIVVAASTVDACLTELGISLKVLELYRKNTK